MSEEEQNFIQEVLTKDIESIRATMNTSHDMMCLTKEASTVYVNTRWLTFTGRKLADVLKNGRFGRVHKEDISQAEEIINSCVVLQKPYRVKYRLLNSENTYRWVVEDGRPFFTSDGTSLGFVSKCIDIDKEKKMEIKLHFTETKYRRLFEAAYDGILILDSVTGEITDVNPFLKELLGYSKEEFLGKKLWELGAFKNTKASKESFKILQEVGYVRYEDLPLETKDGKLIPVEIVSNTYIAGNVRVMQCNIRDISARKRAEDLEKTLAALNQEKQKKVFIADVTHELRTPLAIIKGNVELLLREKNPTKSEVTNVLDSINVEISHLSSMLLDLAVLTTEGDDVGKNITLESFDLIELITRVTHRLEVISNSKKIKITIDVIAPVRITGDVTYLEKLFSNLVSNALYYGKEKGTVKIDGVLSTDTIMITITDDGIGISEEDLPYIFERFYRSTQAREVNQEGTGLGLAISKWIVEAHNGDISVTSKIGKGTTFTVSLPLTH